MSEQRRKKTYNSEFWNLPKGNRDLIAYYRADNNFMHLGVWDESSESTKTIVLYADDLDNLITVLQFIQASGVNETGANQLKD